MNRKILALIALCLALPAHADVSDLGNLTIGGQGIIVGSMTVQGSAFSVGGATFSVAGGSITLGGRLNAAAAGIKWADGTTSTTASSGSAGSTGGPASFSTTFTVTNSINNAWNVVSVSSFSNVSQAFFYGLESSVTYRGNCDFYKRTVGSLQVQFNDDTGSNYSDAGVDCNYSTGCAQNGGYAQTSMNLTVGNNNPIDAFPIPVTFHRISTGLGKPKTVWMNAGTVFDDSGGRANYNGVYSFYSGSANLSSMRIFASAGTFDGYCVWEKFITTLTP